MSKGIISDMLNLNLGPACSFKESGYKKNETHHFITKVTVNSLNVNGGQVMPIVTTTATCPPVKGWYSVRSKLAHFITLYINLS